MYTGFFNLSSGVCFFSTNFFYFFTRSIFGLKRLLCNRRLEVELLRASQPHLVFEGPRSAVAADAAAASGTKKTFVRHSFDFLFERRHSTWPGDESNASAWPILAAILAAGAEMKSDLLFGVPRYVIESLIPRTFVGICPIDI